MKKTECCENCKPNGKIEHDPNLMVAFNRYKDFSIRVRRAKEGYAITSNTSYLPMFFPTKRKAVIYAKKELDRWCTL